MEVDTADVNSVGSSSTPVEASPIERVESPVEEVDLTKLYHIITDGLRSDCPIDVMVNKLRRISNLYTDKAQFSDMLIDVFVQCEIETSYTNKNHHDKLANIIKTTIQINLLPPLLALERFDVEVSDELGLLADKKTFSVSYNRLRTKLYFKQRKYNLLREENIGFSKIIVCLFKLDSDNIDTILEAVTENIGRFRVCPNRVLDLVLEALEYVVEYSKHKDPDIYVRFIKKFYDDPQKLIQLIILKINFYTTIKPNQPLEPIHCSFYRLLAVLLSKNVIELDDIYAHLRPSDSKLLDFHKKLTEEARVYSRNYNVVNMGEPKEEPRVVDLLSHEDRFELIEDNHKTNLCLRLIEEGDWCKATELGKKLPEYYLFKDVRVSSIACDYIGYLIDPVYRENCLPRHMVSRYTPKLLRRNHNQITSIDELQSRIFPMLSTLGPYLGKDILLLTKFIRLIKYILNLKVESTGEVVINKEEQSYVKCLDVLNESILPSMNLVGSNTTLAKELWSVLRLFRYQIRYKLYYNWGSDGSNEHVLRARGKALEHIKYHMKRMSKDTIKFAGRSIGKVCAANPVIVLQYILIQLQSFDNLINVTLDSFRYLSPVAIDVALYCVLESLIDPKKSKKSADGLNIAPWLTSLSSFSSSLIFKFKVDILGFLNYISNQLKTGNSIDLILLADLIQKMTGIEAIQTIADEKLEALMGGELLRAEGAYYNQDKRSTRKSSSRLKDALIESRLANPLCILMAQLRDRIFFNQQDTTHLKLIGLLYDQCQETFVQYGAFVSMNLSIEHYIDSLPPIQKLMLDYKLDPDSAFFLARPMIMYKIKSRFEELRELAVKNLPAEEGETPELSQAETARRFIEAAKSIIDPLSAEIEPALLASFDGDHPNSKLFVLFWTLSMSDIDVPINCYEREIQRLKNNIQLNDDKNTNSPATVIGLTNKMIIDDELKRRKERERCHSLIVKLKQEQAEQVEHAGLVKMYLESERSNLFTEENCLSDKIHLTTRQFDQHCAFSRSILSATDAIYAARFISYLHELKVETFPTMICLDKILCDLTFMISACTEYEAKHFGRFLCNVLKTVHHWHSSEAIFKKECENHPGCIINVEPKSQLNYENYRHLCNKWHYRLTRSFTIALESLNYIQTRNALIVMIAIIDYYPAIKHFGKGIGLKVDEVRKKEKDQRQDLYALATSYAVKLDERKPNLVSEADFHIVELTTSSKDRHSSSSSRKKARHN